MPLSNTDIVFQGGLENLGGISLTGLNPNGEVGQYLLRNNYYRGFGGTSGPSIPGVGAAYNKTNVMASFEGLNKSMWSDYQKNMRVGGKLRDYENPSFFDDVRQRMSAYGDSAGKVSTEAGLRAFDRADTGEDVASQNSFRHRMGLAGARAKVDSMNRGQDMALELRDASRDNAFALREDMSSTASQSFLSNLREIADRENAGKKNKNSGLSSAIGGLASLAGIFFGK